MEKAYFKEIRAQIIPLLNEAKEEIVIAMAWFTSRELFDVLISCLARKVSVKLVLLDSPINYMEFSPDFNLFINAGGILRIADSTVGFMHHKFCVIDRNIAITGSYNWTYYAETRNIENIFITDSADVVNLYLKEHDRLTRILSISSSCCRLSWDEIVSRDDIDFRELNYEIRCIGFAQNKPIRNFFVTKTEVVKTELKKTPLAKYSIGITAINNRNKEIFDPLIDSGTKLPYHSEERMFYLDSKNNKDYLCPIIFGNPNNKREEWYPIKFINMMDVVKGTYDDNLPILFSMQLDDNGSLRIDVSCNITGKRLTISALDSNFIKYESRNE